MNDRMTELYAKACLDARDIHPDDVPAFIACMAEKFAELIVQGCADFVRENYDHEAAESIAWCMEIKYGLHGDYA